MMNMKKLAIGFLFCVVFTTPFVALAVDCATAGDGAACSLSTGTGICSGGYCQAAGGSTSGSVNTTWLRYYYDFFLTAVNSYFVPILFAVAFAVFLWGIYKYFIQSAASESEKGEGKKFAMWGIIGFVIISSVWGLVNIVNDTLIPSTANQNHPTYPKL